MFASKDCIPLQGREASRQSTFLRLVALAACQCTTMYHASTLPTPEHGPAVGGTAAQLLAFGPGSEVRLLVVSPQPLLPRTGSPFPSGSVVPGGRRV